METPFVFANQVAQGWLACLRACASKGLPVIPLLWALRIRKEELARVAQEKQAQEEAALQETGELKRAEEEQQRLAEKDRIQREQEEQEKQAELQSQVGGLCKASSAGGGVLSHNVHPGNWELQCNIQRQCDSNTGPKLRMGSFSCIMRSFAAVTSVATAGPFHGAHRGVFPLGPFSGKKPRRGPPKRPRDSGKSGSGSCSRTCRRGWRGRRWAAFRVSSLPAPGVLCQAAQNLLSPAIPLGQGL